MYKILCNVVCQIGSTWTNSGSLNIDIDNLSISGFRGTSRSSTTAPTMNQLAVSSPTSPMHPQLTVNRSPGMQHFYLFLCLVSVLHYTATFISFTCLHVAFTPVNYSLSCYMICDLLYSHVSWNWWYRTGHNTFLAAAT